MPRKPIQLTVGEVFTQLKKAKTKKERKAILEKHDTNGLRALLCIEFNPSYKLATCLKDIEFAPDDAPTGHSETHINASYKILAHFIEGKRRDVPDKRKRQAFIQYLEQLDPVESSLIVELLQNGKIKTGVTKALVNEVWEGLIP